jgi:hypothetical protein
LDIAYRTDLIAAPQMAQLDDRSDCASTNPAPRNGERVFLVRL